MHARLFLAAAATTLLSGLLSGCDGLAPLEQADCQSQACPTTTAPAAAVTAPAQTAPVARVIGPPASTMVRTRRQTRYTHAASEVSYRSSDHDLAGGRRYVGLGATISEAEGWSERRGYSESSSSYAYGARADGEAEEAGGGSGRHHRRQRGYRLAGVDERGYLTWPGKVER